MNVFKLPLYIFGLMLIAPVVSSCGDDGEEDSTTVWDDYADYRNENLTWISQCESRLDENDNPFYERLVAPWNTNQYILIHWFNDRSETADNLVPLFTSTANTWYVGRNYKYEVFDADSTSYNGTNFAVNSVISGWQLALMNMHVGDSVEIITPYQMAYAASTSNSNIPPYSALQFNIRLRDIPTYELRP